VIDTQYYNKQGLNISVFDAGNLLVYMYSLLNIMSSYIAYCDLHQYKVFNNPNVYYITYPSYSDGVCREASDYNPHLLNTTRDLGIKRANEFIAKYCA
jgi:hypothetical protein